MAEEKPEIEQRDTSNMQQAPEGKAKPTNPKPGPGESPMDKLRSNRKKKKKEEHKND